MADLSKLKKRNSLGEPPPREDASRNLSAPEVAPSSLVTPPPPNEPATIAAGVGEGVAQFRPPSIAPPMAAPRLDPKTHAKSLKKRIDGRTLRKTGRTLPFSTRVSEAFDEKLRLIAQRDGLNFAQLLEKALDAYELKAK